MNIHLMRFTLVVSVTALVSVSCVSTFVTEATPTPITTPTPERLSLIDGEIDPCLLLNPRDVETVLGIEVTQEKIFLEYMPSCKYSSTSNEQKVFLIVSATTDMSIKKANQPGLKDGDKPISAVKAYEREKIAILTMAELRKFKYLDNLGDQAFLYKSSFLVVSVVKNSIFYQFNGQTAYGVDQDDLIELTRIGLERVP